MNYLEKGSYSINAVCSYCGLKHKYNEIDILSNHSKSTFYIKCSCNYTTRIKENIPKVVQNRIEIQKNFVICDKCNYYSVVSVNDCYYIWRDTKYVSTVVCSKCRSYLLRNFYQDLDERIKSKPERFIKCCGKCKKRYFLVDTTPHNKFYEIGIYRKYHCETCNIDMYTNVDVIPKKTLEVLEKYDKHGYQKIY